MNYTQLISELIDELSYRVGIPNIYDKEHQRIMSEILTEWGNFDEKKIIFEFLTEAEPNKNDDRYKSIGYGRYKLKGKEGEDEPTYEKDDKGNYVKLAQKDGEGGDGETKQEEPPQGQALKKNTKSGKSYHDNVVSKEEETRKKLDGDSNTSSDDKSKKKYSKTDLLNIDHKTTDEQLNMTKSEAAAQAKSKDTKDVGAGTAESRAGEAMVHKGLRLLKDGISIEEIEQTFKTLVFQKDHILNSSAGKKWVNASLSTIQKIDETIGIENIEDVSWDTKQGRRAIGVDPNLETSSDMFVRTKDGKNIGISLKKDGKVFLNNGGWAKQSELLLSSLEDEMPEDDHKRLSEAMSIDAYKKDLEERFSKTTETITPSVIKSSFQQLKENPNDQKEFQGSNREKYFKILENPDLLVKKIKMGTANGNEQKSYAKLLQTYHKDEYNHLRESDNGLTTRAFKVLNQSEEAKQGMNRHIIKSMHISETLGLNERIKDGGVDGFVTMYGIEPDGAALNEQTLITLLGSNFKQRLDETISEVRSGNATYKELENFIVNSIEIDYESGQILFKHESNKKYPLFKMSGRTRGIGSSPVMEMVQTPFMAHALKMGTFNTDEWDEKSLKRFKKDIVKSEDNE